MMNRKYIYKIAIALFCFIPAKAELNPIDKLTDFLKKIEFRGVLSPSGSSRFVFNVPQNLKCYTARHHYLWDGKNLLTMLDGTGYLLKYEGNGQFGRMDSTCYEGYNFGAFNFVYRDTIFSIGGYGFWQFNGMVRYFDQKNADWVVYPTNKIVPLRQWFSSQFYFDVQDSKVYALYHSPEHHELVSSGTIDKNLYVQCFDLVTKKWWDQPRIFNTNSISIVDWDMTTGYFHTQWGRFLRIENQIYLLDFKKEKLLRLGSNKKIEIQNAVDMRQNELLFSQGNCIYFFKPSTGNIDSVVLQESDFIELNLPFYLNEKKLEGGSQVYILLGAVMLVGVLAYILWRKKLETVSDESLVLPDLKRVEPELLLEKNSGTTPSKSGFKDTLTEIEKSLFELLVHNALQEKMTTAVQMNQVLGIAKKPVKIQNNIRASNIMMINKKFMVYSGLADDLITKERTAFDKRIFEFTVEKKYLLKVK